MKILTNLAFLFCATLLIVSCKNAPKGEEVKVEEAVEAAPAPAAAKAFNVNSGTVIWTATKVGGEHQGTLKINNGDIKVEGGNIVGGKMMIDMNSLTVTDLEGDQKADLEGHLKSGDFFEVEKFPAATFQIVSAKPAEGCTDVTHEIVGNLTMHGMTKSITIPVNVVMDDNSITAVSPAFKINRTDWGVKYGSGIIGTAQDKIIHDEVSLVLNVKASATPS